MELRTLLGGSRGRRIEQPLQGGTYSRKREARAAPSRVSTDGRVAQVEGRCEQEQGGCSGKIANGFQISQRKWQEMRTRGRQRPYWGTPTFQAKGLTLTLLHLILPHVLQDLKGHAPYSRENTNPWMNTVHLPGGLINGLGLIIFSYKICSLADG